MTKDLPDQNPHPGHLQVQNTSPVPKSTCVRTLNFLPPPLRIIPGCVPHPTRTHLAATLPIHLPIQVSGAPGPSFAILPSASPGVGGIDPATLPGGAQSNSDRPAVRPVLQSAAATGAAVQPCRFWRMRRL